MRPFDRRFMQPLQDVRALLAQGKAAEADAALAELGVPAPVNPVEAAQAKLEAAQAKVDAATTELQAVAVEVKPVLEAAGIPVDVSVDAAPVEKVNA